LQAEGEFALVMEKLENVMKLNGQPVKRGTMAHEHIITMMLAEAAVRLRNEEALDRYTNRLEELAGRDGHRPYLAIARRARGVHYHLTGEFEQAEAHLQEALALFNKMGAQWQAGRTLFELADLKSSESDKLATEVYLGQALENFKALQAGPDIARTQALLAELA
jgi:tetratricopeptide (TPR) repeat protein